MTTLLHRVASPAAAVVMPAAAQRAFDLLGWKPTGVEQARIVACRKQAVLVTGGEGGGKSEGGEKSLLGRWFDDRVLRPDKGTGDGEPHLYWLVGEDYKEVSKEFFYLEQDLARLFPETGVVKPTLRVDPGQIEVLEPGKRMPIMRVETKSAKDPMKISRDRPDGILICEAGQVDFTIYERCHGRALQGGGWLLMVGTLEGSVGWYPNLAQAWDSGSGEGVRFKLPTWTNTALFPGGINDPKIQQIKAEHSDLYWMERIAGEIVPPAGLVLPEFRADLHVREVEYDPEHRVHVWEDPGYGTNSAHAVILAQKIEGQVRVFDEIYVRGQTTEDIIAFMMKQPYWQGILPPVIDPQYKDQHHATHSVHEIWQYLGKITPVDNQRVDAGAGIERFKTFLKPDGITGRPGIVFSPRCRGILSELGAGADPFETRAFHPWKYKAGADGTVQDGAEPDDKFNHSCKAVIYGLVFEYGYATPLGGDKIKLVRRYR